MNNHDYTDEQALGLLMDRLTKADAELAKQVQEAVNVGRDVQQTEQSRGRGKKKERTYRRTVPYSMKEALQVALNALRAHFVVQPMLINSCHDNMAQTALGVVDMHSPWPAARKVHAEAIGREKILEIELHTETQIIPTETQLARRAQETLQLARVPDSEIEQQLINFDRLQALVDFTESSNINTESSDGNAE